MAVPSFRPSSIILGRLGFSENDPVKEPLVMKDIPLPISMLIDRTLEERRAALTLLERTAASPDEILPVAAMAHALKALGYSPEALGFGQPEHAVLFPPVYKSIPELAAVISLQQFGKYVKYVFSCFNNHGYTSLINDDNGNTLPGFLMAKNVMVTFTPDNQVK
jgi:hypothetical protein